MEKTVCQNTYYGGMASFQNTFLFGLRNVSPCYGFHDALLNILEYKGLNAFF